MTVEIGLIRDLQDDPFDRAIRGIFGDWLEDHGDPARLARRRLLQVQTELADWIADVAERRALYREEERLLAEYGLDWLAPLGPYSSEARFRDGLIDVTFDAGLFVSSRFVAESERLFDAAWIGSVRLEMPRTPPRHLANCPALARVRQLDLRATGLTDETLAALLTGPHLGRLVALDLSNNLLTDESASLLSGAQLSHLVRLDLRNNHLTAGGVRCILNSERLPRLRSIEVHGNRVETEVLQEVLDRVAVRDGVCNRRLNSIGMEFIEVPAGVILMGSPESEPDRGSAVGPIHEVELTRSFYLSRYLVTQRQYELILGNNPAVFALNNGGGLNHPAEMVTRGNADLFCERLSQVDAEILAGCSYRLPTEAEWEHACRAGTFGAFSFGHAAASRLANFDGRHPYAGGKRGAYIGRTTPVGTYPANGFGLFDLHGNVWEWCADYYDERYYSRKGQRKDPTGPRSGTRVSARGGSWSSHGSTCRSASRDYWYGPHYCRDNIGFRVVLRTVLPSTEANGRDP